MIQSLPWAEMALSSAVFSASKWAASSASVGESVAVGAGVKADRSDVLRETLQFVEGFGPLGSSLAGAIGVVGTNIKSLPVGTCERQQRCRNSSQSSETHY